MLRSTVLTRSRGAYSNREERAQFTAAKYAEYLTGKVLDVGCFRRDLKKFIKGDYTGIDLYGEPDIVVDLEQGKLPFPDRHFDAVVCTDVLEHLEMIHSIFDEMLRVSRSWIIVSLPNNRQGEWLRLLRFNRVPHKYYGLPVERPSDRHRWYFGAIDAEEFIAGRSASRGADLVDVYDLCTVSTWKRALTTALIWNQKSRRDALVAVSWYLIKVDVRS